VALAGFQGYADESGAELTLLVEDAYQGHGLGRRLLMELIAAASGHGFLTLLAEVLPDNERMLRLLESAGPPTLVDPTTGSCASSCSWAGRLSPGLSASNSGT